jgi:GWxTD domain-containing protein
MRKILIAILTLIALSATAQTPPREFANGPAKWLMTSEEQKAWRDVKTDDQAIDFIDLFWARRDPTPGTGRNENRLEFERRVAYADANFKEGNTRGAMTERGRVLILLGFPKNMDNQLSQRTGQFTNPGQEGLDPSGGRRQAAKDTWEYDHAMASKYGMPKIDVVFIFDQLNGGAHRDPQRTDFTSALPGAIRSYITSPELTTVPDWASSRLERNRAKVSPSQHIETTVVTTTTGKTKQVIIDAPAPVAKPAGVGRMMLLNDSMAIQPQSGLDPFGPFTNVSQFKKAGELGWAAEYCSGQISQFAPSLKVQLRLTDATGASFSTDPEEFVPDSIKSEPGCYLLRGSLALADMDPGKYSISLTISGAENGNSYNLVRDFELK